MIGFYRVGLLVVLGSALLSGCGQNASDVPAAGPASNQSTTTAKVDSGPIARAATDFMQAVIKGDSQSASALLTPQAIERIIATKTQFNPSGLQSATFQLGEIRTPAQDQAIVQFLLTDSSASTAEPEEGCCLMKLVANEWRVSGIAYGRGPHQPWTLSDFETGQTTAIPRQSARGNSAQQASATMPIGRPSPPRTAEQAPPSTVR